MGEGDSEQEDPFDPVLARRFDEIADTPAPEVWARVTDTTNRPRRDLRWLAIAAVALIGVAAVGATWLARGGDEAARVTSTGPEPTISPEPPPPTEPATPPPECDTGALAASLRQGMPEPDYQPTESLDELIAQSEGIVRGQLVAAREGLGGIVIDFKPSGYLGAADTPPSAVISAARVAPAGELTGNVIAFLAGEPVLDPQRPDVQVWHVAVEGLWVACDDTSPAVSVQAEPGGGWWDPLGGTVSLDELWRHAQFPGGETTSQLPSLTIDEGAALYDIRLVGGERLRLALPPTLAETFELVEQPAPAPIRLSGDATTIEIRFGLCEGEDSMTLNASGMATARSSGSIRGCRVDEQLRLEVLTSAEIPDGIEDQLDLRLISSGTRYGPVQASLWPAYAECCAPWGPLRPEGSDVVVNRIANTVVEAVDATDLRRVWSVDTGGAAASLHPGPGVMVEVTDGPFLRLDPTTGAVVWQIERSQEHAAGLSGHSAGVWLLRSSFSSEGDDRPPVLRRIDVDSGAVLWTAFGRPSTEWQPDRPIVLDDLAIAMDVWSSAEDRDDDGATVRAFDLDTGAPVWATPLDSSGLGFSTGLLAVFEFETGNALVARTLQGDILRIDPLNGEILWRTTVSGARFGGTDLDENGALALDVVTPGGRVLLDPDTGEPVGGRPQPPSNCTALVGNEPWLVFFESDPETRQCVVVAEWQDIQLWNKGSASMEISWPGGTAIVGSDTHVDTGPIGRTAEPGRIHEVSAPPYPDAAIWVMPATESAAARLSATETRFGPIEVGMSLDLASAVSGLELAVDVDLAPGPACWTAVVASDPYSPSIIVFGDGGGLSEIIRIVPHGPDNPTPDEDPCR